MENIFIAILGLVQVISLIVLIVFVRQNRNQYKQQQQMTTELLRKLENIQATEALERDEVKREEWQAYVTMRALDVLESLDKQQKGLHAKAIEQAPTDHGLTDKELLFTFSTQQLEAILTFWKLFNEYKITFWLTEKKKIKNVFKEKDVLDIQENSKRLKYQLDHLFQQLKNNSK
ncbi:hypothetical protein [Bacillus sp. FJAT-45350]|uniref:hypothetical protein n=1 Tax=Bacillus sp. FJAT-45350 TaxID=2011014 RepID=UPI000BB81EEC|nr:hypothetical protein [Bacillus sp. FJAT-45350]